MEINYILKPTESALQLYEKVASRGPVSGFMGSDLGQFFHSPSFYYLKGNHSTGRTEFIYQLILSTILPSSWGPVNIGGCGQSAIYFDLDLKFSVQRFIELTKFKLLEKFEHFVSIHGQPDELEEISVVVKQCFDRLYIMKCTDELQLAVTLRSIVSSNGYDDVKLVALDSLDCFYYPNNQSHYFKSINLSEVTSGYLKRILASKSMTIVASVSLMFKVHNSTAQILTFHKGQVVHTISQESPVVYDTIIAQNGLTLTRQTSTSNTVNVNNSVNNNNNNIK